MLHIVEGDLLKSDCDVIVQQCNCFGKQGAGIAKQIVRKYPKVHTIDKNYHIPVGSKERLGNYSTYRDEVTGLTVVNMYSQYRWGRGKRQTDYQAMETALMKILTEVEGEKVGLPYLIGCGLAGGNWNTVNGVLNRVSSETGRDIYLYKL